MNVAFFLKPKSEVRYLCSDTPLPQALELMQHHGYSSVPVIDRNGKYVSTVREGDFLNFLAKTSGEQIVLADTKEVQSRTLGEILHSRDRNPPCSIDEPIERLLSRTADQNFIPIVDDRGIFIGIVTRRMVINYFLNRG